MTLGFVGLGIMGLPMATHLLAAGQELVVWNRSRPAVDHLAGLGAHEATDLTELFERSDVVLMMLAGEHGVDATLPRGTDAFAELVAGRTLVHLGTTSPAFSVRLGEEVAGAGGWYAEAPVSGSRPVAEAGQLVVMLAGEPDVRARVAPLLAPLGRVVVETGPVGSGLLTKLAVNLFLITQVTGLVEAFHFAAAHDLDLDVLRRVVDEGPMASTVSRAKLAKLVAGDWAVQAGAADVLMNAELVVSAAHAAGVATPLAEAARDLFAETVDGGWGGLDMAAVLAAVRGRSTRQGGQEPWPRAVTS
ncbi:3-hydroxyisobutyrate dehydrogenase [Pedococcus dokdonensis]|uniref:3-hydroxyisobutyrate dehydrogenase n=1 Tax=Pedococcus dokdonensis TaxID=443156 RepID=A0A1H0QGE1_9MICO|nr:NAD(P)-dependent oxidoreductase [Pedococcus dokdonensis]SDP16397.1 3-hydroxyisobutyrate dehydrogenase [Pedococcus dokdonensis]